MGNIGFKIIMNFLPSLILCILLIGITPPYSIVYLLLSLISIILGFFVLYNISFIISLLSFWFYNIWSISTIKNVIISVLSGTLMPIWFIPQSLVNFIKMTPFDTIYFIPISLYLGRISSSEVIYCMAKQAIWIIILASVSVLHLKNIKQKQEIKLPVLSNPLLMRLRERSKRR